MEDDCPDKLKILVNDKIRAFRKVEQNREDLFQNAQNETLSQTETIEKCKETVDNFELNRLIYKELDYYNEEGKILGEHPIFEEEVRQREVDEMSTNEAHKNYRNLATYISKEKRNLKNAKTEKTKAKIQSKLNDHKAKRGLIAKKLKLDEE